MTIDSHNLTQRRFAVISDLQMTGKLLELLCKSVGLAFAGIVQENSEQWFESCPVDFDFPDPASYQGFQSDGGAPATNFAVLPITLSNQKILGYLELYDLESRLADGSDKLEKSKLFAESIGLQIQNGEDLKKSIENVEKKQIELNYLEQEIRQYQHISSHTLKEPLRKLNLYTNLLENELRKGEMEKTIELSLKIQRFAQHFSTLIEDVSRFADLKPAATKFESVNLNEIVLMVCSQISAQIQEKEAWIEKEALPTITAVPLLMTQLFLELLRNALWFSRKELSPVITISAATENDNEMKADRFVTLKVVDNGIGIADYHLQKIFDVFERFHPDGELPGSGIGLAYCQKIVHYHGGTITPHSVLGEGTTFTIRLPIDQP